jgi:MFS family permease
VIGIAVITWSFFTAACGMATSFVQLLLLRIGVGIGEAGGAPPSQSLIADSFPPERRSGALSKFALGAPIGASIGLIGGGLLADVIGWRWTLVAAGAPGLLVGVLVLATLKDPHRRVKLQTQHVPTMRQVLTMLFSRRAFLFVALGGAMLSFVNYGAMAFAGSFYLRNHLEELKEIGGLLGVQPLGVIGLGLGLMGVVGGSTGALMGGRLGDRYGVLDVRALALIPAAGSLLCAASFFVMFMLSSAVASLLTFGVAAFFSSLWYGPGTLAMQRLAGADAKATALAVALFVNSVIGLSFGPLLMGVASDILSPELGEGEGLRMGVLIGLSAGLVSGLLYWLASRTIRQDVLSAEIELG